MKTILLSVSNMSQEKRTLHCFLCFPVTHIHFQHTWLYCWNAFWSQPPVDRKNFVSVITLGRLLVYICCTSNKYCDIKKQLFWNTWQLRVYFGKPKNCSNWVLFKWYLKRHDFKYDFCHSFCFIFKQYHFPQ